MLRAIKNQAKTTVHGSKNFTPLLEFGGPWDGLDTETHIPSMHSLAQSMKNRLYLRRNKNKNNSRSCNVSLQPSPPA
jgi:hypothetical protein